MTFIGHVSYHVPDNVHKDMYLESKFVLNDTKFLGRLGEIERGSSLVGGSLGRRILLLCIRKCP